LRIFSLIVETCRPSCSLKGRVCTRERRLMRPICDAGGDVRRLATHDTALLTRVGELKDYTTICSSAPSELLALMGLRARFKIIASNLALMRSNLVLLEEFFAAHADRFEYHAPQGSTVVFPQLLSGSSGARPPLMRERER
jgi:hypothetical protein